MDKDVTWYRGRPRRRDTVLDRDPAPPKRGTALQFPPMSIVAKPLDASGYHLEMRQASAQVILC